MSSDSNSSSSEDPTDQNPNPNPNSMDQSLDVIEGQLASIAFTEANGSLNETNHEETSRVVEVEEQEIESSAVVDDAIEEVQESGVTLWRNNSELEVDGNTSPSSSGYAGERGSSSVTSASGIEEASDDHGEIREVGNNGGGGPFDEAIESQQAPWVPGKRHVDEVS